jgi:hypothetical protein
MNNDDSLFFSIFNGELVYITTELTITGSIQLDMQHNGAVKEPMAVKGYLLDEDSDYYYLGDDAKEITQCVMKTRVVHCVIIPESAKAPKLLLADDFDTDDSGKKDN